MKKVMLKRTFGIILIFTLSALIYCNSVFSQVVSPLQGGHYSPGVINIRDMAPPPQGVFLLWYNSFSNSNKYIDRDGNKFDKIRLDQIHPALPNISVDIDLDATASIPGIFWGTPVKVLGGARYSLGTSISYISAKASILTERNGIILDTTYTQSVSGKNSGFSDLYVVPAMLSWGFEKADVTFVYGFSAPTGRYESGADDNMGLGFWTHMLQEYTYFYPVADKSSAIMLGLTYEMNGKISDTDVKPGNRFSLEWGISQYLSERFELGILGGHNWQVSDDTGDDVYWNPEYHDRKSTLLFNAGYWLWEERLQLNAKYGFDYGVRQRFKNNYVMLNLVFVPNILAEKKSNSLDQ